MRKLLTLVFVIFCFSLLANFVENQPFEHTQPDGTALNLLVSGDEYYHRVHDANGYTILLNPDTGYAVYAIPEGNSIRTSDYVVGTVDPSMLGIQPNLFKQEERTQQLTDDNIAVTHDPGRGSPVGTLNNIVVFVRFLDQTEFPTTTTFTWYNNLFNSTSQQSLADYYDEVSNGQLDINTYLYRPNGSYILSIQVSHNRGYYSPWSATNTIGYTTDTEKNNRHWALFGELCTLTDPLVPAGVNVDTDNDNIVDALTFIWRGGVDNWGDILWPTHYYWSGSNGSINGEPVWHYVFDFEGGLGASVVCHEMGHMIGFPDLYHYTSNGITPVGQWSLMATDNTQHELVYEKMKYGTWVASIPTITPTSTPTQYSLTAIDQNPYSAYKIASNYANQFYVLEYRRDTGRYESGIPGSGLIVYRVIDYYPLVGGSDFNGNASGPPDELFVYRPGGDIDTNGTIASANLSSTVSRTAIHTYTDPQPWIFVNTTTQLNGNLVITDIGASGGTTITFTVRDSAPNIWDGSSSADWNVAANWSLNSVPTSSQDVEVPTNGLSRYPSTIGAAGFCRSLKVLSGAIITVSSYNLTVYGNIQNYGQLVMNSTADLTVTGNVSWESGSTASVTNSGAYMFCQGNMTFQVGSNVQLANGTIEFYGTSSCHLVNKSANTQLYNLWAYITSPAYLALHSDSTQPFVINGFFYNGSSGVTDKLSYCWYTGNVTVKGNFMDYGTTGGVLWYYPTLIMDGTTQTMRFDGATSYINNLTISPSTSVTLTTNLTVKNKLRIESGLLNAASYTITVGGDWENIVGPTAFTEETSTVIFNGSGHQYCNYTETFNNIVVNKSGGALRVNNASAVLTCAHYDWTMGAVDVLVGTFTANDLIDNGLYGSYYVNPGATINLTNNDGYVDLNGHLIFSSGGTINVYGGTTDSYWPYAGNGSVTMSGGILDFKSKGVYLYPTTSYTLDINITGGTIRTVGGFYGTRTDFDPTGGTVELYGSNDVNVSLGYNDYTMVSSKFYNLRISKAPARDNETDAPQYLADKFGRTTPLTRTNQVTATSRLDINGHFYLTAGTFVAPDTMYVASHWYNDVGPTGFVEGTGLVVFDGSLNSLCDTEIFYNLELNKPGTYYLRPQNTATVTSTSYNWTSGKLYVTGGTFTALDMADPFIYGTMELTAGYIHFHQDTAQYLDLQGDVTISGGELHLYGINGDTYWPYLGNASLTMSNGVIDIHDVGLYIAASYTFTTNITGGVIRTSRGFSCYRADFTPSGGIIELYSSLDASIYTPSGSFYNLEINKAARENSNDAGAGPVLITDREGNTMEFTRSNTAILSSNITCTNSLNIETGTLYLYGHTANIANDLDVYGIIVMTNALDQLKVGDNILWHNGCSASITLGLIEGGGNWWVYGNTNVVIEPAVTTYLKPGQITDSIYNADDNFHFGNVVIDGPGFNAIISVYPSSSYPIWITGNLTIGLNYELDVSGQNVTVNGNLDLDGKLEVHDHTVTLDGKPDFASTSILAIDSGMFTFSDSSVPRDTYLRGTLILNSGTLEAVNNSFIISAGSVNTISGGNIRCTGINAINLNTFQPAGGTLTITSNIAGANYNLNVSNGNWLRNLILNTATGVILANDLNVKGNITITDGRLDLNARVLYCEGDINVYDILEVDAGATLSMQVHNKSLNINPAGRLEALGNSTNTAFFTNPPGYSNYNIESGGTIAANYATFQWANTAGVNVKPGAIVDTTYPLSNCTFKWGVSGGTLLTLNNDQNLAINNAAFITNSFYEAANVRKTTNGLVNFLNATGNYAGESYDDDVYDRVFWTTNATPAMPDLQIVKAVYSDLNPDIGETVTCTVTYLNASTTASANCWLDLYWNLAAAPGNEVGDQATQLTSVPAGIPQQYVFNDVTPDASWAGIWNSWLQIDLDGYIAESNETNNVFGPFNITWTSVALPAIDDLTIEIAAGTYYKRLNWTYPVSASHFNIYRSADPFFIPGPASFIANVIYPTMQYVDTTTADKYFYIVTAVQVPAALQNDALPGKKVNTQRRN